MQHRKHESGATDAQQMHDIFEIELELKGPLGGAADMASKMIPDCG